VDAAGLQSLVGANQRITSKLMLKLLTQDVEVRTRFRTDTGRTCGT
jgi:hypothetical protein